MSSNIETAVIGGIIFAVLAVTFALLRREGEFADLFGDKWSEPHDEQFYKDVEIARKEAQERYNKIMKK